MRHCVATRRHGFHRFCNAGGPHFLRTPSPTSTRSAGSATPMDGAGGGRTTAATTADRATTAAGAGVTVVGAIAGNGFCAPLCGTGDGASFFISDVSFSFLADLNVDLRSRQVGALSHNRARMPKLAS
jgi:hypothetical protein